MPVRRPARPGRRAARRPLGQRGAQRRGRIEDHSRRRHVHPGRRRAGEKHAARRGTRSAGRPLRQDPPLRRVRLHRIADGRAGTRTRGDHGRRRRRRVDRLLRHPFPGALHRAGPPRCPGDRRVRVLGSGPGQTRPVDAAGPRPRARLDELRRRRRSGGPRCRAGGIRIGRTHRGRGSLVVSPLGEVVASAGAEPQLVVADVDVDRVAEARKAIAVLSNRSAFAQVDRAESVR